jgi:hypothetical protein
MSSKYVHNNCPFVTHVTDQFCLFSKKLRESQLFLIFANVFRNFRIFAQANLCENVIMVFAKFSRKCANANFCFNPISRIIAEYCTVQLVQTTDYRVFSALLAVVGGGGAPFHSSYPYHSDNVAASIPSPARIARYTVVTRLGDISYLCTYDLYSPVHNVYIYIFIDSRKA